MDGVAAFGAEMRRQFVLEPGSTFVNHGSYGSVPRRVLEYRLRYVYCPSLFVEKMLLIFSVCVCLSASFPTK